MKKKKGKGKRRMRKTNPFSHRDDTADLCSNFRGSSLQALKQTSAGIFGVIEPFVALWLILILVIKDDSDLSLELIAIHQKYGGFGIRLNQSCDLGYFQLARAFQVFRFLFCGANTYKYNLTFPCWIDHKTRVYPKILSLLPSMLLVWITDTIHMYQLSWFLQHTS